MIVEESFNFDNNEKKNFDIKWLKCICCFVFVFLPNINNHNNNNTKLHFEKQTGQSQPGAELCHPLARAERSVPAKSHLDAA